MGMCVMNEVIKLDVFLVLTLSWIFQFVVLDKYIKNIFTSESVKSSVKLHSFKRPILIAWNVIEIYRLRIWLVSR